MDCKKTQETGIQTVTREEIMAETITTRVLNRIFDDCMPRKDGTTKGLHTAVKNIVLRTLHTQHYYVPTKRTALDGKVWWVVLNDVTKKYTSIVALSGKYKTRKACLAAIDQFVEQL